MNSLKISFNKTGASFDFTNSVTGNEDEAQMCMVNIGTNKGSDLLNPTRGTNLFSKANFLYSFDKLSIGHACNFAGADTLYFVRQLDAGIIKTKVASVSIQPVSYGNQSVNTNLFFTFTDGTTLGKNISLPA